MSATFITLTADTIEKEHICCAFSDKKCSEGYELKKKWLKQRFEEGYVFRRLDERAKVFIEYGPGENCWLPLDASDYLVINCFWVSGQYKGKGYAKALLQSAWEDAVQQGRSGLATVVGTNKYHFMSDGKWLLRQGFEVCQTLPNGFSLLVKKVNPSAISPTFKASALSGECENKEGVTVYYTNRCPFTEYYVHVSLMESIQKRNIPLKIVKLETTEEAQAAPSPATIFSMFYKGKFVTTDVSACIDSRFDKFIKL